MYVLFCSAVSDMRDRMEQLIANQDTNKQPKNQEILYKGHSGPVHHIVTKGSHLYTSSADNTIKRFDIKVCISSGLQRVLMSLWCLSLNRQNPRNF